MKKFNVKKDMKFNVKKDMKKFNVKKVNFQKNKIVVTFL
jgi:hypothetical protein